MSSQLNLDLRAVRAKLATRDNWAQQRYVDRIGENEFCYCLDGAILTVAGAPLFPGDGRCIDDSGGDRDRVYAMRRSIYPHLDGQSIHRFNDTHTYEEVLAKVDAAIGANP